jgi:hypothetical protein
MPLPNPRHLIGPKNPPVNPHPSKQLRIPLRPPRSIPENLPRGDRHGRRSHTCHAPARG